jgi:hypothetical protein
VAHNRALLNRHFNEVTSSMNGVRYVMTNRAAVTLTRRCMTEQVGVELML